MSTYHFIAASEAFLTVEEPLEEVLRERVRHYGEQGKEIDFWLVKRPAFLDAPQLEPIGSAVPRPAAAVPAWAVEFFTDAAGGSGATVGLGCGGCRRVGGFTSLGGRKSTRG